MVNALPTEILAGAGGRKQVTLKALALPVMVSRMVMVGDSVYDLQMAANAGVASVGVSWGAARRETLLALNPLAVVDDTAQLAQVLGVSDLWDAAAG